MRFSPAGGSDARPLYVSFRVQQTTAAAPAGTTPATTFVSGTSSNEAGAVSSATHSTTPAPSVPLTRLIDVKVDLGADERVHLIHSNGCIGSSPWRTVPAEHGQLQTSATGTVSTDVHSLAPFLRTVPRVPLPDGAASVHSKVDSYPFWFPAVAVGVSTLMAAFFAWRGSGRGLSAYPVTQVIGHYVATHPTVLHALGGGLKVFGTNQVAVHFSGIMGHVDVHKGVFDVRFHVRGFEQSGDVTVQAVRLPAAPTPVMATGSPSPSPFPSSTPRRPQPRSMLDRTAATRPDTHAAPAAAADPAPMAAADAAAAAPLEHWRVTHCALISKTKHVPFSLVFEDTVACHRPTVL